MRPRAIPACAALVLAAAFPAAGSAAPAASPRPAVRYLADAKLFVLKTARTSYVLGVDEEKDVQLVYWGARLSRDADLELAHTREGYLVKSGEGLSEIEYLGRGGLCFAEPCLKVSFADGVRDLVLKYVSHEIRGDTLVLRLKDVGYDLGVSSQGSRSREP